MSVHQTAFGLSGVKSLSRMFLSFSEKSTLCVVTVRGFVQKARMPISFIYLVTVLSEVLNPRL